MTKFSHQKNNELRGRYKCPSCQMKYTMEWALQNHVKHCVGEKK